jgi:hypothetical protein
MLRLSKLPLFIPLLLAAPAALAFAVDDYSVVRGYDFAILEDYRVELGAQMSGFHGTLARQRTSVLDGRSLERALTRASALIMDEASRRGLEFKECRSLEQLDIYQVPEWLLADRTRFSLDEIPPEVVLWGVYDPLYGQAGESAILVIDHKNPEYVETMLAHELAHYWVDRLCWTKTMGLATEEDLAYDVQAAYSREHFGRVIR